YADARGARGAEPSSQEGAQAPDGLDRPEVRPVSQVSPAPREEGRGQRLPRARRITRGDEIRALFRRGKRSRTAHLDVFHSASPVSYPRVGVVVPRYKRRVVERNLVKRRLRE